MSSALGRLPRSLGPVALAVGTLALVAACGGGSSPQTSGAAAAGSGTTPSTQPSAGAGRGFPGVSGTVAAISGSTLQVQGSDSQTAVTYTGTTTFTDTVTGSASDVVVGACVTAFDAGQVPTARPSATPSARPTESATLAATTVTVSQPVDGSCDAGFGGVGGRAGTGTPPAGAMPSGAAGRRALPSRSPGAGGDGTFGGGGFGGFGGAVGRVSSVQGSTFVVTMTAPRAQASPEAPASPSATSERTVTTTADTTYLKRVDAAATDVTVGSCVTAQGGTDETGAMTATSIEISAPGPSGCVQARGGQGRFRQGGSGQGGSGQGAGGGSSA